MRHLLGLMLLLAITVGSEAASLKLGRRVRDESNGYQIQPPDKWEQVPTKFQDVAQIGKWVAKRAKRGIYAAELHVLRFLKPPETGADDTPEDALKRGIPGYAGVLRNQPKDIWTFVKDRIPPATVSIDEPDLKMSRKSFKAHLKVFEPQGGGGRNAEKRQIVVCAAQIETVEPSDSVYGVAYFCTKADAEDMIPSFRRSIKRFRILEDDDEEDDEAGPTDADIFVDSEKKPEAWRAARRAKLIKGWRALDTDNYLIVYNKEVKRPLLKKIALHIEAIRSTVYAKLFPPTRDIKSISVVRVCKDRSEYHRYGGPQGSAGYWSPGDEELVFYQDKSNKKDSLRVLYHEAFHQYIHYAVGKVAPHSWFNEGHGDYFAGHNYRSGAFRSDVFRWRTGTIANALSRKTYVPLEKFLKYTQGEYYANPGLCYAQGWSLVYFLREVERRKIKKYKKYYGLLDRYFEAIKRNVQTVKEKAIEGLDEPPPDGGDEPGEPPPDGDDPADPPPDGGDLDEEPDLEPDEENPVDPNPENATETKDEAKTPGLPSLPGLDGAFPGEKPATGAAPDPTAKPTTGSGRTVSGPRISGTRTALDAAVDEVFLKNRGIDIKQLEKDWIEFSK